MFTSQSDVDSMSSMGADEPLAHHCDDDVRRRVKRCLADQRPELGRLDVQIDDGTVRVLGTVGTFYLRQLALSAVSRVDGVRHVIDDMDVPVPSSGTTMRKPR